MSRKWLLVIGVVLVAAALVAGQRLLSRPRSSAGTANSGTELGALTAFPRIPSSGLPARKVTDPAPAGQTLAPLADAPGRAISALKLGSLPNNTQYAIRMRPYGIGPSAALGSQLVILVETATPIGDAPADKRFAKANLLVLVDTSHGGTVTSGGAYTATLTFRSDGEWLLPVLSEAAPAR
jgi:hypothetical protein